MQKCQNCDQPFTWIQINKSFWGWMYKPIICANCGTRHDVTIQGRLIFVFLTIAPALAFVNFLSPFDNFLATLGGGILLLLIGSLITPFIVKFREAKP